jgi:predicted NAD-dependent protein-ADP-ribosyltransferase YbiA (DUF1768 family)
MYNPADDGHTHINAYSRSRCELGRALSNFANAPFVCEDGWFASIEAYWYYLGADPARRDELRPLSGYQAKKLGRELGSPDWQESSEEFKRKICAAITAKLQAWPEMQELLRQKKHLPIVHYYYWESKNPGVVPKVTVPKTGLWVWEHWNMLRESL